MSNALSISIDGPVLICQFTRPQIRSPLSIEVLDELDGLVDRCSGNGGLSSVIFTGTGDVFASGADLREIARVDGDGAPAFARRGQRLMTSIASLPQMTIAAVNGFCFGGALDLALACDRRVASAGARFAHPGAGLGIINGWGGTQRLPRLVGRGNALELFFTAEPISAERALAIGLIDEVTGEPLKRAMEICLLS